MAEAPKISDEANAISRRDEYRVRGVWQGKFALMVCILTGLALPSSQSFAQSQTAVDEQFRSAARAGDFASMRFLVAEPVTWAFHEKTSAGEFFNNISHCKYNGYGNIISWVCPPNSGPYEGNIVALGQIQPIGTHVRLIDVMSIRANFAPSGAKN